MTGTAWPIDIEKRAERLVVEGVRRYMGGYSTGDIRCWEMAWELYASVLGTEQARQPVSELSCYARALNKYATRHFCLFPYDCTKLCQDECLVTALVSAAQSKDNDTVEVISSALIAPGGHKDTIFAATEFAAALKSCGLILNSVDLSSLTLEECPLRKLSQQHQHH